MAAISVSPLPTDMTSMPSRRTPLSNNPNAINSPFRGVSASSVSSKSKRPHANLQLEETSYGQPPPAKKQILDAYQSLKTPPRYPIKQIGTLGIQSRKENGSQQLILERKALRALEKTPRTISKADWNIKDDNESIRQWQKHNRRMFPSFVFYFENVASEAQVKYAKAVMSLGAREEKFFSNTVTHVITTRNIPPENQTTSIFPIAITPNSQSRKIQTQISSTSLDRCLESANTSESVPKSNFAYETAIEKKTIYSCSIADSKRQQGRSNDVLYKARELGMKIWSLEKLERIINVMFDTDTGNNMNHGISSRIDPLTSAISRLGRDRDLQQLLRNERMYGPSDRDLTVASKELYTFRGPYIYIYDIDEKQKPIMVREYPKVLNKEDGDWPQFRSVSNGKCPFIDEVDYGKREAEREMEQVRIRKQIEKEKASSIEKDTLLSPGLSRPPVGKRVLEDSSKNITCSPTVTTKPKISVPPNKPLPVKSGSKATLRGNAFVSRAGIGRLHEGEPVASGVQPAITSAIHSTMSSTAAQPGLKAGTSKEVHDMQRKVLEKKILALTTQGLQSSHIIKDKNVSADDNSSVRSCKKKNPEKLAIIEEVSENLQAREKLQRTESTRKTKSVHQPTAAVRQESKPGYCENCQDKFEDFNEHVISRKHRKFAEKLDNWKALDALLTQLARPLRDDCNGINHIQEK
ncbi:Hsk1-interacting molecule 1 [Erysiphe necator]|nr:Hsk1-interacting molecule 1 [Erysiphe necator]